MSNVLPLERCETLSREHYLDLPEVTELDRNEISPEQALRLIDAFPQENGLNAINRGLDDLEAVCEQRVRLLENIRTALLKVANRICALIARAGLVAKPLPRGYRVLQDAQELYLVRDGKAGEHEKPSKSLDQLVFTDKNTLFARLTLRAQPLRPCDLNLFYNDLESGLLHEMTAYVSTSLGQVEAPLQSLDHKYLNTRRNHDNTQRSHDEPDTNYEEHSSSRPAGAPRLQDLGRSRKKSRNRRKIASSRQAGSLS